MTATTSNGMIWSWDLAIADSARPTMADATVVAAMTTKSSRVGLPSNTAPWVGAPLPRMVIAVTIED